jgi:hypothetical protein
MLVLATWLIEHDAAMNWHTQNYDGYSCNCRYVNGGMEITRYYDLLSRCINGTITSYLTLLLQG